MIFINTRPTNRAKPLSQFLQQQNIQVIELPLLELMTKPLDAAEQQTLANIAQATAIVLVSEQAVKYGLARLATNVDLANIAQLRLSWIAVGEKTAEYFSKMWQRLSDTPPPDVIFPLDKTQQNNEGMLTLAAINSLQQGDNVQLWRGVGGRDLLANSLKAKGIQVNLMNFYQRGLPALTVQKFGDLHAALSQHSPMVVLISSLTSWQHWQQLLTQSTLNHPSFHYLVLQNRIATLMQQEVGDRHLTVIDDLHPMSVLNGLKKFG